MTSSGEPEAGLTLIEMMVAIFVIGIVLMAMAATAIASQRAMQTSEGVMGATQLGNEILESYLARDFEDLGLYADDAVAAFGGPTYQDEELVTFPSPLVEPDYTSAVRAAQDISRNGVTYRVRTAVLLDTDAATDGTDDFKRIIVELTWDSRGATRTSSVEAIIARDPENQMLSVVVAPDTIAISSTGSQQESFTITVVAREPQSNVVFTWQDRNNVNKAGTLTPQEGGLLWSKAVSGQIFANGGTLFTVVGTLAGTTQKDVTTVGRALFLEDLELPEAAIELTPEVLSYRPGEGYCESSLIIEAEVTGAIFSDPATVIVPGGEYPMKAMEPPLDHGTLYRIELDLGDVGIAEGVTSVSGEMVVTRPTGATEFERREHFAFPIAILPELEPKNDPVQYAPCPT